MHLDVFKSSAFDLMALTALINKQPYTPTAISQSGLFVEEGISTTKVSIEMIGGVLTLVPNAPRGAPGAPKGLERRTVRDFRTGNLPQRVTVMASEVQDLRALGSESDTELATAVLAKKLAIAKRDLDLTHEFHRVSALKGIVFDADGTTPIYNFYTEFGVTQTALNFALSVTTTKVLQNIIQWERMIEDKLGGQTMSGIDVWCSPEFMDALTGHPLFTDAYRTQQSQMLRENYRRGFTFGNTRFIEYRGTVNGVRFIAANEAYAVPSGVPDLFKSLFSPPEFMETVNTIGLPYYAKQRAMDFDVGIEVMVVSCPLHMNTRPDAILKITAT